MNRTMNVRTPKAATQKQAAGHHAVESLTEYARGELERMILDGEITSGERLHEQSLAARLGVSRGPLREAIRVLAAERLVSATPNQGVFVRQISGEEAAELYDIRAVLFGLACQRLARIATPTQVDELAQLVRDMDDAATAADGNRYFSLNLVFHETVLRFSGRRRTQEIYTSLVKELHLLRQQALTSVAAMQQSNDEHRRIVEAISARNSEPARQLAEIHVQGGKRRWLESLDGGIGSGAS